MSLHEEWISRDAHHSGSGSHNNRRSREDLFGDDGAAAATANREDGLGSGTFSEQDLVMNVSEFLQRGGRDASPTRSKSNRRGSSSPALAQFNEVEGAIGNDSFGASGGGSSYATIDSFLFGSAPRRETGRGFGSGVESELAYTAKKWLWRIPRIVAVLLLPLYIGCVIAMFALDRGKRGVPLFVNDRDWMVLLMIGVASQLSLIPVVLNIIIPDAKSTFQDLHSPSDYYAPFVLYPVSAVFFSGVAIAYAVLDKKAQRKDRIEVSMRRRSKLQTIYAHLTACVEFRSELLIPVVIFFSALFAVSCRFCTHTSGVECAGANQFWDPYHLSKPVFYSAALLQFCMYICLIGLSALAIGMYWQHQRLVRVFTFPEKFGARSPKASKHSSSGGAASSSSSSQYSPPNLGGSGNPQPPTSHTRLLGVRTDKRKGFVKEIDWHDLSNPEGIANYIVLYRRIISSMNHHPVMTSICTPAFACSVVVFVISLGVVVVDNMYQGHGFADFTFVFMSLMAISGAVISLFIILTVQLDKTIGLQSRIIAKVQNDVQQVIDARRKKWVQHGVSGGAGASSPHANRGDEEEVERGLPMKLLEAKVNALQALDVYVRIADSTPKLIGMSLNTIRWSTILALLLFINFFFILLYRIYCFDDPPAAHTRTPTIPFRANFSMSMDE